MKRLFCVFATFLTFSFLNASEPEEKSSKFIEFNMSSSTTRGIERERRLYSGQIGYNAHWFDLLAGIQVYEDVFDATFAGEIWFPFTNWYFEEARLVLGVGGIYHFQRYKDISSEHDYIFDSCFRYRSYTGFTLTFRGGYSGKTTKVDALAGYVPLIHDHYPEFDIRIDKVFSSGFEIYYSHGTHDLYRYPVFCSPTYTLGGAANFDSGLRFGGEAALRIVDQYTTAPYVDSLVLRMTVRYTF